jgi:hypothetical protein
VALCAPTGRAAKRLTDIEAEVVDDRCRPNSVVRPLNRMTWNRTFSPVNGMGRLPTQSRNIKRDATQK